MILEAKTKKLTWLLLKNPTKKNLVYLNEHYRIDNEDLVSTLPPLQRPRVSSSSGYVMIILQFPYYNKTTQEIKVSEVDIFIGSDFFITVTDGKLPALLNFFYDMQDAPQQLNAQFHNQLDLLLHELLNRLLKHVFPMLNHISQDLDNVEHAILDDRRIVQTAIKEILGVKRNIVNFRRVMKSHKEVIMKLIHDTQEVFSIRGLRDEFEDLIGLTIEIWASLDNYRETINALHETQESLINHRTNQVMKTLTIFSVIVFPLTLLAAIFGMNTTNIPLVNHPYGFWIIVAAMFLGALGLYGYFKVRRWI